eukprot:gene15808-14449_t
MADASGTSPTAGTSASDRKRKNDQRGEQQSFDAFVQSQGTLEENLTLHADPTQAAGRGAAAPPAQVDVPDAVKKVPGIAHVEAKLRQGNVLRGNRMNIKKTSIIYRRGKPEQRTDMLNNVQIEQMPIEFRDPDARKGWLSRELNTDEKWTLYHETVLKIGDYQVGSDSFVTPAYDALIDPKIMLHLITAHNIPATNIFGYQEIVTVSDTDVVVRCRAVAELDAAKGPALVYVPLTQRSLHASSARHIEAVLKRNRELTKVYVPQLAVEETTPGNLWATASMGPYRQNVQAVALCTGVRRYNYRGPAGRYEAPLLMLELNKNPMRRNLDPQIWNLSSDAMPDAAGWTGTDTDEEMIITYDTDRHTDISAALKELCPHGYDDDTATARRMESGAGQWRQFAVQRTAIDDRDCPVTTDDATQKFWKQVAGATFVPLSVIKDNGMQHIKATYKRDLTPQHLGIGERMDRLLKAFDGIPGVWAKQADLFTVHVAIAPGAQIEKTDELDKIATFCAQSDVPVRIYSGAAADPRRGAYDGPPPPRRDHDDDGDAAGMSERSALSRAEQFAVEENQAKLTVNGKQVTETLPQIDTVMVKLANRPQLIAKANKVLARLGPEVKIVELGQGQKEKTLKAKGLAPVAAALVADAIIPMGTDTMYATVGQTAQLRLARRTLQKHATMGQWRSALWRAVEQGAIDADWGEVQGAQPPAPRAAPPAAARPQAAAAAAAPAAPAEAEQQERARLHTGIGNMVRSVNRSDRASSVAMNMLKDVDIQVLEKIH